MELQKVIPLPLNSMRLMSLFLIVLMTSFTFVTSQYEVCEKNTTGQINHHPCISAPVELVATKSNLTVEPVNSTCGLLGPEPYCTLGVMTCAICDANNASRAHPPSAMSDMNVTSGALYNTWWQSKSWMDHPKPLVINITASFNKTYELVDDLIIVFKSPRPSKMTIYKSTDYGKNWTTVMHYRTDCSKSLPGLPTSFNQLKPDTPFCTTKYSGLVPYSNAPVKIPVREFFNTISNNGANLDRLYNALETTNLTKFLRFTDIRISLEETNTDGNHNLNRPEDLMKYYYAIAAISISGSCFCNYHGQFCIKNPAGGGAICVCSHNTMGRECEKCLPLYNNRLWKPGSLEPYPKGTANECQKCECNGHATSCVYNVTHGTGYCQNCAHNTTGKNCHLCIPGFHHNKSLTIKDTKSCVPCICDPVGTNTTVTTCADSGQCSCKTSVTGLKCDRCIPGHYGLKLNTSLGTCKQCLCFLDGTLNYNNTCNHVTGQCQCKPHVTGRTCNTCEDGYYGSPKTCLACDCNSGGSKSCICNKNTGQCPCRVGITGRNCSQTMPGYYVPTVDAYAFQPLSGNCKRGTGIIHTPIPFTNRYYFNCTYTQAVPSVNFQDINGGKMTNAQLRWQYIPVLRYSLNGSNPWQAARIEISKVSNSVVNLTRLQSLSNTTLSPTCPDNAGIIGIFTISNLPPGQGKAAAAPSNVTLDVRCVYSVTLTLPAPGNASRSIVIDSILMAPDHTQHKTCKNATAGQKAANNLCFESVMDLKNRSAALAKTECSAFNFAIGATLHNGANPCACNTKGSSTIQTCLPVGGQCTCKPGVIGRSCNQCAPGFFNFTPSGCTPCNCDRLGSSNLVCNETTGQCPCRSNVATAGQLTTLNKTSDLRCGLCLKDHTGLKSGKGCTHCNCNSTGSISTQCGDSGCTCKNTIGGKSCDKCVDGYFGFSPTGCRKCNCTAAGSVNASCNIVTGQCNCKPNAQGLKCNLCKPGTFNLDQSNPQGCQPCFCFGHGSTCIPAKGFKSNVISADNGILWTTTTKDALLMPSPFRASMGSLLGQIQNVGFRVFPPQFYGDRVSSYNQMLLVNISVPSGSVVNLTGHPLVILKGPGGSVGYNTTGMNLTAATRSLALPLHHLRWKVNATAAPDPFTFLKILQNLTGILVQQTFGGVGILVTRGSLVSTIADPKATAQVNWVENCTCNATTNTAGRGCELCTQGFQRQSINGSAYETCKACNCNKRAATAPPKCDMNTGVCLNCRNGTIGSQCEFCAPNVQGADCDSCTDKFWGISKTGCKACACSKIGATNEICEKVKGQCPCKNQVVGRQCDQCADNHHNLTSSGCAECNGCYRLVFNEVVKFRQISNNFTNYVTLLESRDNNTKYGPFQTRLDQLVANMTTLKDFLLKADISETTIGGQIKLLNVSLKTYDTNVTADVSRSAIVANSAIVKAASLLKNRNNLWKQTNGTMFEAQKVHDQVKTNLDVVKPLVDQLQNSASTVNTLSGGTIEKSKKVVDAVNEIDGAAKTSAAAANNAAKISTAAHTTHVNTAQKITELRALMDSQTSGTSDIQNLATYARGNVTALQGLASLISRNATNLQQTAFDVNGMRSRAQNYITQATALASQAESGTAEELRVMGEVTQARNNATPAEQQTQNLVTSATQILNVAQNTVNQAYAAKVLSTQVFLNASTMLNTIQTFQTQAVVIEAQANSSLKQIPDVSSRSATIKDQAHIMSNDLAVTKVDTDVTLQALHSANESAAQLSQHMAAAKNKSDRLALAAAPHFNNIPQKLEEVVLCNRTTLNPFKTRCDNIGKRITAIDNSTVLTQPTAARASTQVNANRLRIEAIASTFTNMRQLNSTQVQALRQEIRVLSNIYDSQNFLPVLQALNKTKNEQEAWLKRNEKIKEELRATVSKLRDVVTQLRVISGP